MILPVAFPVPSRSFPVRCSVGSFAYREGRDLEVPSRSLYRRFTVETNQEDGTGQRSHRNLTPAAAGSSGEARCPSPPSPVRPASTAATLLALGCLACCGARAARAWPATSRQVGVLRDQLDADVLAALDAVIDDKPVRERRPRGPRKRRLVPRIPAEVAAS